jgi:hypothetical protein
MRTRRLRDQLSRPPQPATTAPPVNPMASRLRSAGPPGPSTAAGAAAAFFPQPADTVSDNLAADQTHARARLRYPAPAFAHAVTIASRVVSARWAGQAG